MLKWLKTLFLGPEPAPVRPAEPEPVANTAPLVHSMPEQYKDPVIPAKPQGKPRTKTQNKKPAPQVHIEKAKNTARGRPKKNG
jgi:hypothetical protein